MEKQKKIADLIHSLLKELGETPDREGLVKTPARVAKSLAEILSGYKTDTDALFNGAFFKADYSEMVVIRDITFYSMCEHHMLPFFGKAHVAYIPDGKIVGLSKVPKLVRAYAARLQVQERMTLQIARTLQKKLNPLGVGVVVEARHLCMEMRGAKSEHSPALTSAMLGVF